MSKLYPVGIVGERNYQSAIKRCRQGERVYICHEPDNPYDDLALKVETGGGQTIGYIARTSWLRDAIHEEGRGCTATILSIAAGDAGALGVVLNVALSDDDVRERSYASERVGVGETMGAIGRSIAKLFK
ncbi:HIRAN domain-containing protein [Sphingomonas laterariae]|uniref:HIRAN domain-containing protein n=1 Tax=Edaphosphingomonas laterariae TaxID=861865 RepID=A0A239F9Q4_9SPHN|nr:HIRAN domain-containing protein [Sphingomonas laterariae]SNS53770.1 HIRAN domain-containing protein [Sphingomonas laterariae]